VRKHLPTPQSTASQAAIAGTQTTGASFFTGTCPWTNSNPYSAEEPVRFSSLERETTALVLLGCNNRQAALTLDSTENAVKKTLYRVGLKLGIEGNGKSMKLRHEIVHIILRGTAL
jgi:DNA-binding NarL/FixJ family response regulator